MLFMLACNKNLVVQGLGAMFVCMNVGGKNYKHNVLIFCMISGQDINSMCVHYDIHVNLNNSKNCKIVKKRNCVDKINK